MPYFVLKKGAPCEVPDLLTWARWFDSRSPDRVVEQTHIGEAKISTVFFGLDPSTTSARAFTEHPLSHPVKRKPSMPLSKRPETATTKFVNRSEPTSSN